MFINSVLILFIILVVWIVIIAMIVGYKALYKRRANQALDGIHSSSMIDPLSFFQVIIMVITLILGIVAVSRIQTLSNQLIDQQTYNSLLNQNINWLKSDVSELEETLQDYIESNAWVQQSDYEFNNYNETTNTVSTTISFTLKEIESNADVYLIATNQADSSDFIKVLVVSNTLTFSGDLDLDFETNYQISFVSETDLLSKGGLLFEIDIPDLFDNRFNFSAGVLGSDQVDYEFQLRFSNYGIDNWMIESAVIQYYNSTDVVISSINVLSQVIYSDEILSYILNYETIITNPDVVGFKVQIVDSFGNTWTSPQIPLGPEGSE